eukprot:7712581-Prorocentrum_lima.AAC.1
MPRQREQSPAAVTSFEEVWDLIQTLSPTAPGLDGITVPMLKAVPKMLGEVVVREFHMYWAG